MGCAEQALEVAGEVGLWEEGEDPAAVVVDDDEDRLHVAAPGQQQPILVVEHGEVPGEGDGRPPPCQRGPEGGGDETVDAARAAVGHHPQAASRAHERLQVPDRHARCGHKGRAVRAPGGEVPGGPRLCCGLLGVEDGVDRRAGGPLGLQPPMRPGPGLR